MIKKINLIGALVIAILLSSCIEEIDFEVPKEYQNSTVIVGKIVKGNPSSVEVFIQKIFDFSFVEERYLKAQGLRIVDQNGNSLEIPRLGLGSYRLDLSQHPEFIVEEGRSYSLEVDLFDGQRFKSKLETILPVPKIKSIDHRVIQKEIINDKNETVIRPRVNYAVNTSLIAEENQQQTNIKWDFEFVYKFSDNSGKACYVNGFADFDLIQIIDSKIFETTTLTDYNILELNVTDLMTEGQYITVIQESLSDDALSFWSQARELSINSGTFYEPPPGQIISNIETVSDTDDAVFGYFYGTQHDTMRVFVDSAFTSNFNTICPMPPTPDPNPPCDFCCDCENVDQSTTRKPSFWIR